MSDGTKIEWTDATLNVVNGCSVISPGCANCYAMRAGGRNLPSHPSTGLTRSSKAGHVWTGEVRFNEERLRDPLRWKRPRMIFWNAHGDLFHDAVPDAWVDRCLAVMALTPHHVHQVLTKRSARMRRYFAALMSESPRETARRLAAVWPEGAKTPKGGIDLPLPNLWLGVSTEDQARADERIPDLLATPAAVRWISAEPLLGPLDLQPWLAWPDNAPEVNGRYWGCVGCDSYCPSCPMDRAHHEVTEGPTDDRGAPEWMAHNRVTLDWVVAGGESGPGSRPMHPDWVRSLRDQCAAAEAPFLFKQWGDWKPCSEDRGFWPVNEGGFVRMAADGRLGPSGWPLQRIGKKSAGRDLDGAKHDGFPARVAA